MNLSDETATTPQFGARSAPYQPARLGSDLIARVLHARVDPTQTGWIASVRRGIAPASEVASYGYTETYLHNLNPAAKIGVRRAAAITAAATGAPQSRRSVGASLAVLHREETGVRPGEITNAVTSAVNALPVLDLENAAQALSGLIRRVAGHGIDMDFYDLADLLGRWGNGISPASRKSRERLVIDYYA